MRSRSATLPEVDGHGRPTRVLPTITREMPLPEGCNLDTARRSTAGDLLTIRYTGKIDAGGCADPLYTTQGECEAASETWTLPSLTGVPGKTFDATADHDGARPLGHPAAAQERPRSRACWPRGEPQRGRAVARRERSLGGTAAG